MLVVHPNSTCDVCLEGYGRGVKAPHSISCGHVFCLSCLESIASGACPLCRERFHPMEIRRLHVDTDASATPVIGPPIDMTESSHEARRLQDSIARIVKDGSSESHLRQLIEDCSNFLRTQPRNMYEELRLSHRMISYLCDTKSKLKKQTENYARLVEAKAGLESQLESLRGQLAVESEAVDASNRRYRELLQTSRDEKETALAVERSLRSHYEDIARRFDRLEAEYKTVELECQRLRGTLNPTRQDDAETHDAEDRPTSPEVSEECSTANRRRLTKYAISQELMVVDKEEMILSPLPEDIRPLTTSINGFTALPEVEFEEKDVDMESIRSLNMKFHSDEMPERSTDVSFPSDSHHRGVESVLANPSWTPGSFPRSSPRIDDSWDITRRSSKSRDSKRPGSRSRSHSRTRCTPSSPSILSRVTLSPRHSRRGRFALQDTLTRDLSPSRERRVINEPEELKSHLYEILADPISSSLPNANHFPSSDVMQVQDSELPSRSGSASSHRSAPQVRSPQVLSSHSNLPSTSTTPSKPIGVSPDSRPVMSHASIAALALETERQRVEKERSKAEKERSKEDRGRHKERERRRPPSSGLNSSGMRREGGSLVPDSSAKQRPSPTLHFPLDGSNSGSLRDSTNSHTPRHRATENGKLKGHSLANLYA